MKLVCPLVKCLFILPSAPHLQTIPHCDAISIYTSIIHIVLMTNN